MASLGCLRIFLQRRFDLNKQHSPFLAGAGEFIERFGGDPSVVDAAVAEVLQPPAAAARPPANARPQAVARQPPIAAASRAPPRKRTRRSARRPVQIFVKTLTGKTIPITVRSVDALVEEVCEAIEVAEEIPVVEQRLIFAGYQLESTRTLAQYGIEDSDTVHLVRRLVGC